VERWKIQLLTDNVLDAQSVIWLSVTSACVTRFRAVIRSYLKMDDGGSDSDGWCTVLRLVHDSSK
jgi:hypothetical protein